MSRKYSSSIFVFSLQSLHAGTVIRFDGRGFENKFFGGMWSRVVAGFPQAKQTGWDFVDTVFDIY